MNEQLHYFNYASNYWNITIKHDHYVFSLKDFDFDFKLQKGCDFEKTIRQIHVDYRPWVTLLRNHSQGEPLEQAFNRIKAIDAAFFFLEV